jgi:hypothetical protein
MGELVAYRLDEQLGYVPAIPEPFWVRKWFRWKPSCYQCRIVFKNRREWEIHYVLKHISPDTQETRR